MKESVFNALTTLSTLSEIESAAVGTNFFFGADEAKQLGNTALRHKVTYHQKVAVDGSLAGQGSLNYKMVFDILESDDLGNEKKKTTRRGRKSNQGRDDDNRLKHKETAYSSSSSSSISISSSSSSSSTSSSSSSTSTSSSSSLTPIIYEYLNPNYWEQTSPIGVPAIIGYSSVGAIDVPDPGGVVVPLYTFINGFYKTSEISTPYFSFSIGIKNFVTWDVIDNLELEISSSDDSPSNLYIGYRESISGSELTYILLQYSINVTPA